LLEAIVDVEASSDLQAMANLKNDIQGKRVEIQANQWSEIDSHDYYVNAVKAEEHQSQLSLI
jgi:hypothetical protein